MTNRAPEKSKRVAQRPAVRQKPARAAKARETESKRQSGKVVLLSGGNPQIAKGDGDEPVQAYIRAMPGWKRVL